MEYWEEFKYLYFSDASSAFTFAIAPFLWLVSLFAARIKRPQIIKTVLFLLMYGYFFIHTVICLLKSDVIIMKLFFGLSLFTAPILWSILLVWSIGEFVWVIRKKVKSEKAQKLKEDFIARSVSQIVLLAIIVSGWWEFVKQLLRGFA